MLNKILVLEIDKRGCQMGVLDADTESVETIKDLHGEIFPVKYMSTFFDKLFRSAGYHCLLFGLDRKYIGVCTFRVEDRSAYVMTFGIREVYRKKRLGSRCLSEVERYLRCKWDIVEISLHVQECNLMGLLFYKSCGFCVVNLIQNYYLRLKPRSAYLLRKVL